MPQAVVQSAPFSPVIAPLRFHFLPLFFAALCFIAGIAVTGIVWLSPALLCIGCCLCSALSLLAAYQAQRISILAIAAVFVLSGAFCAEVAPRSDPQTKLIQYADGAQHMVTGEVMKAGPLRHVESSLPFSDKTREEQSRQLQLRITSVDGQSVNGGIALALYAPLNEALPVAACGDFVQVHTNLRQPDRYLDRGVWDERAYMLDEGIGALANAKAANFKIVSRAARPSLQCRLHSVQQNVSSRLLTFGQQQSTRAKLPAFLRLDTEDATMLTAMLTGDRSYLSRGIRTGFERTGSFHLLVVSGMHLAIFAGIIFFLAKAFRLPRVVATLLTVFLSFSYALFTGFGQPVQRSFWMITLFLIGRLLWRERSSLNVIGFAALGLLAFHPHVLFEAGFQMTLLSVLAIAGIAAPAAEKTFAPYLRATHDLWLLPVDPALPPRVAQFRVSLRLIVEYTRFVIGKRLANSIPCFVRLSLRAAELLLVSIVVELVMSLPMALYFHRITTLALPVNFLVVPLLGILLPSAIITLLAVLLIPAVAFLPAALSAAMLHLVLLIIHFFSNSMTGDLRIPTPSAIAIAAWVLSISLAIGIIRRRRFAITIALTSLAAAAVFVMLPRHLLYRPGALEITAIDVGQGDSLLVVTPDGKTLLIDGGGLVGASPESKFDTGEDVVSQLLWARGIRRLDAVAITHAHIDHIGGLPSILANFRPHALWVGRNPDSPAYDRLMREAQSLGIPKQQFAAGSSFRFGNVEIEVLSPASGYVPKSAPSNDDSLVLRIAYGSTSALLEGDAEAPSERRMLAFHELHSDLLKVGHHGSKTSTTPDFLRAVSPAYAVISVGRHNYYGHPKLETLDKLAGAHIRTWRTDLLGASTFYLDGKQVTAAAWDQ
ncbi:MAG TPA: ComEC/Rec2 family competence protein [Alloacidobacterium sp.]|nr:ComEC/Rec2 family competence protein [Alloacidobacterium sp.]